VSFLAAQPQAMHLYLLPRDSIPQAPRSLASAADVASKHGVQPVDRGHSRVRKLQPDYSDLMMEWFNSLGVTKGSNVDHFWYSGINGTGQIISVRLP
jgi:hypothetical protein